MEASFRQSLAPRKGKTTQKEKITPNMEDARLKEKLPQEGTGRAEEFLPEHSSDCPTYSE